MGELQLKIPNEVYEKSFINYITDCKENSEIDYFNRSKKAEKLQLT